MSTLYPDDIDAFTMSYVRGDGVPSLQFDNMGAALTAIEAELGANPSGSSLDVAARFDRLETRPIRTVTATTSVLASDVNGRIICDPASLTFISVGDDTQLDFPVGASVRILQISANGFPVQVVLGSGSVSLTAYTGAQLGGLGAAATLDKIAANTWNLSGNLVPGGTVTPPPTGPYNQLPLMLGMNNL